MRRHLRKRVGAGSGGGLLWRPLPQLLALALALALTLALTACSEAERRVERPAGSALWIDEDAGPVSPSELAALEEAGVREVFLTCARLEWVADLPHLVPVDAWPRLPRGTLATLVVQGAWPEGEELIPEEVASALRRDLRTLSMSARGRGLQPVGFHLDLAVGAAGRASFAETTRVLGLELGELELLSATVDPRALTAQDAAALVSGPDFVVVYLYGQRPGEPDDADAWDLEKVAEYLGVLDGLGEDYMVGVRTLGWVERSGRATGAPSLVRRARLGDFSHRPGVVLEDAAGYQSRDQYRFRVDRGGPLGDGFLSAGERLRVLRASPYHLRQLLDRAGSAERRHHLGEVFYQPPQPGDELSLSPSGLADLLAGRKPGPRLEARLISAGQSAAGPRLRVELSNVGDGPTMVSDDNRVELVATRGLFDNVGLGDFQKYRLVDAASGHQRVSADTLRLYVSLLAPGDRVTTGAIELRGGRTLDDVIVGGAFKVPGGSEVRVRLTQAEGEGPE